MNFLKKAISVSFIAIIALIDIKIVIDYKIIKPTEKYTISVQTKTVAKILELDNIQPEEAIAKEDNQEETETVQEKKEELLEEITESKEKDLNEPSDTKAKDGTESDEASFYALSSALSDNSVIENVTVHQIIEPTQENNSETIQETTTENPEENLPEISTKADNIVSTAKSYIGYNYVSGGASPETGFDCSGFTKYVYSQYGITLNRVAECQADNGTPINKEDLQPGDLVLFSYYGSDSIGHSGIYIGDGNFIHAANSNRGVVIDTLESGYYADNYVTARRF